MNSTLFRKMQVFCLIIVSVGTMNSIEPDDSADLQKEAAGTGEIVHKKLSEALEFIQQKGIDAAGWVNTGVEKVGGQAQKIRKNDLFVKAKKTVEAGFKKAKAGFENAVNKVKNIDLTDTKKTVNKHVDFAKSTAKGFMQSCKNWWNEKPVYSSDEFIIMGGAVVAVVTIAGITYILYKNGTIKAVGKGVCKYPALTTLSAVTVGLLVAAVYKIYTTSKRA